MLTSDFLNVINEIEDRHPVEQWRIGSIHVWPMVRIHLAHLFFASLHRPSADVQAGFSQRAVRAASNYAAYLSAKLQGSVCDSKPATQGSVVLLSDGLSYATVAGRAYEKFCDPVIDHLQALGIGSVLLTPLADYRTCRHTPPVYIQPRLDALRASAFLSSRVRLGRPTRYLPHYDSAMREISARLPIPELGQDDWELRARYVDKVARYFEAMFARLRPPAAFVVSYYCLLGFAYNLACHRSGVVSIDLQHGTPGELHPAYCRWKKTPPRGFELLPSLFWCWSELDGAAIEASGEEFATHHRAVVGGNMMQDEWIVGESEIVRLGDETIRLRASPEGRCKVLLTLQPGVLGPQIRQLLLEVIAHTADEFCWWVRLHPTMLDQRKDIESWLANSKVCIDMPTELPLHALLRHTDIHVTYSSSTVVEAEAFGVRSVVLSRYGEEFFPAQLQRGSVLFADTTDTVIDALRVQLASRRGGDSLTRLAAARLSRARSLISELARPNLGEAA